MKKLIVTTVCLSGCLFTALWSGEGMPLGTAAKIIEAESKKHYAMVENNVVKVYRINGKAKERPKRIFEKLLFIKALGFHSNGNFLSVLHGHCSLLGDEPIQPVITSCSLVRNDTPMLLLSDWSDASRDEMRQLYTQVEKEWNTEDPSFVLSQESVALFKRIALEYVVPKTVAETADDPSGCCTKPSCCDCVIL